MTKPCAHHEFRANVNVARLEDIGKFIAEITIRCVECHEPFRFVGLPAGIALDRPTVSIDELELHAPIEPEGEKQLQTRYVVQMPERLSQN